MYSNSSGGDTDSNDENLSNGTMDRESSLINSLKDIKNCDCNRKCHSFGNNEILFKLANQVVTLDSAVKKQLIYSCLTSSIDLNSSILFENSKRNRIVFFIPYIGKVCRKYFCTFWKTGKYQIRNYLDHIKKNFSLTIPVHGNLQNRNASLSTEVYSKMEEYLNYLLTNYGEPIATRKFVRQFEEGKRTTISIEKEEIVYLPSYFSYEKLYSSFVSQNSEIQCSIDSLKRYWMNHETFKNMKIRNPSKDVCDECSVFKNKISSLADEEFTELGEIINDEHQSHISQYRYMRNEYEKDIMKSRNTENKCRPIVLSFDYAQNVEIPHLSQQPGLFYFSSLKKAYQFGVVDEELDEHHHYLYMESEGGKGSDNVVSMVIHYIKNIMKRKSKHLILWADNCGGQNKNSTMIHTLLDLVRLKEFDVVELKFQIKGHTRNSVDRGFGYTKRQYLSSDVYSLQCLANVISRSAVNSATDSSKCIPVILQNCSDIFKTYTSFYSSKYKKCPKVQSYQIFRCDNSDMDSVSCMSPENPDERIKYALSVKKRKVETVELKSLTPPGFSIEKKVDFYNKIRHYIPPQFLLDLCPEPTVTEILEIKKLKSSRANKNKKNE
jgi:hypothetical protein